VRPANIPKRIFQIWGSKEAKGFATSAEKVDLPLLGKASSVNLQLLNPDFEYHLFDNAGIEQFVDAHYPHYRAVFDKFPEDIQRYDFFRYLVVYHFGGFYFDTDVFLASSLESLLGYECVFPFEHLSTHKFLFDEYGMDWEIGNYGFGAVAGHPFIDKIIANVVRAQENPEWAEAMTKPIPRLFRSQYFVLDSTGPGLVSRTLAEYAGAKDRVKVLFPENVCDPKTWFRFGEYGVHLQIGAWRRREPLLRRVLHRHWLAATRSKLLKESRKLGGKRSLGFASPNVQTATVGQAAARG